MNEYDNRITIKSPLAMMGDLDGNTDLRYWIETTYTQDELNEIGVKAASEPAIGSRGGCFSPNKWKEYE